MDELGKPPYIKAILKSLSNKRLLLAFLLLLLELILVYSQNWKSIFIFLYPLFTIFGFFFFLIYIELQRYQMKKSKFYLRFHLFGNESLSIIVLFFSAFIQILIIGLFGLDSKKNPHLMPDYGIWYTILINLIFIFTWFLLSSLILIKSSVNLIISDRENHLYYKIDRIFGISNKIMKKIQIYMIILNLFIVCTYFIDSLLIDLSQSQSGVWRIKFFTTELIFDYSNYTYISGFSYFILFFSPVMFLIILGIIIKKIREISYDNIDKIKEKLPEIKTSDLENIKKSLEYLKS
ncbi:MAG: hypothetical protein ACTSWX_02320 [Promethearchaeota archaeon]